MTHRNIVTIAVILAWFVVMLGAYTRLTDAGLGCPDWPGCYGHLVVKSGLHVESLKAWTEMIHRYLAGTLALLILVVFIQSVPRLVPSCLLVLVIFQALLGMWTVTLKLLPIVVMSHLLGGMLIFSLLVLYRTQLSYIRTVPASPLRVWVLLGAVIVFCQIALGGWVTANYAGIACIGFPQCNGLWLPHFDFTHGFYLFSPIGDNYQGGLLASQARITIQLMHRLGAVVTLLYWLSLVIAIHAKSRMQELKRVSRYALILLALQLCLGVLNAVYLLPLPVAVLHNGVAALLMATSMMLVFIAKGRIKPYGC